MHTLLQDLRYAARLLRRAPAFTIVAVATLALGIGATTGVFSVVDGVLLRPLPYHHPDQLVAVQRATPRAVDNAMSAADFLDFQARNHTLAGMAASIEGIFTLRVRGVPVQVARAVVTSNFFPVLGVTPLVGRVFGPADAKAGGGLLVLSEPFWRQQFGSDPRVIGRAFQIGNRSYTVVGVVPASFAWPHGAQVWQLASRAAPAPPVALKGDYLTNRGMQYLQVAARLRSGVTAAAATADLETIQSHLARLDPDNESGRTIRLTSLRDELVGPVRPVLLILLAAVTMLLLIACVNVANLLLARATGRGREIGIRTALGAGRGRLIRQLVTESLLLSLAGGAAGLLLAAWITDALAHLAPHSLPRLADVHVDLRVALFALAVSAVTGILFGIVPAWQVSKAGPIETLRADTRTGTGASSQRTANVMVVAQVGLSLVLLIAAGLIGQSLLKLIEQNPGFRPDHVVSAQLFLPPPQYPTQAAQVDFYRRFLEQFAARPGAPPIAITCPLPLDPGDTISAAFKIRGRAETAPGHRPLAGLIIISPGYFHVMDIPLERGRLLTDADRDEAPRAILINRTMAQRYWPGADPLGGQLDLGMSRKGQPTAWFTVVGVVGDVRTASLRTAPGPQIYLTYREFLLPFMTAVVRSPRSVRAVTSDLRSALAAVDPSLPLGTVRTMPDVVAASVQQPRLRALVLGSFAVLALALAVIGIYGLMNYSVVTRTREFGVRMALGAGRGHIVGLVVGRGLKLLLVGTAAGIVGAWAVTRALSGFLYGVAAADPLTYVGLSLLLVAAGVLASYMPARRATRIDPMIALRSE
ncbi:MAG TPA: ABC transporter permease [Vicinamibacterales bacterium]|nr:ABC transporter permease [Vicinamibacterales bacterium]